MIDLGLGVGPAVSSYFTAPGAGLSVAWRPISTVEIQAGGMAFWVASGDATREGILAYTCFCDGSVTELGGVAEVTLGVFPASFERGTWTVTAGLRVGGAVISTQQASFFEYRSNPDFKQEFGYETRAGWIAAAVAEVSHGHLGGRIRIERVTWSDLEQGLRPQFLVPALEGFLRW